MNPALFRRAIPYLLTIATVLGCLWGAYRHGVSVTDTAWEMKWNEQAKEWADAKVCSANSWPNSIQLTERWCWRWLISWWCATGALMARCARCQGQ